MRRTLCSIAVMLLAVILIGIAVPESANAQCCTYTVQIDPLPQSCYPVRVSVRWQNGCSWATSHSMPGTYTITPPSPQCPPCALPAGLGTLQQATIGSFATWVGPNGCACLQSGTTPCVLRVCTFQDANNCWVVRVSYPCP